MADRLYVLLESKDGNIRNISLEVLSAAKPIAEELGLTAAAITTDEKAASQAAKYVSHITVIPETVLPVAAPEDAAVVLAGSSRYTRDALPFMAAIAAGAYLSDCVSLQIENGKLVAERPVIGGKAVGKFTFNSDRPVFVSVRPHVFEQAPAQDVGGEINKVDSASDSRVQILSSSKPEGKAKTDVAEADVVISGGRGMKSEDNFSSLQILADKLSDLIGGTGAVGASRAVVDSKWRDYEEQVGKSGKSIAPRLYFAAGISGQIHHILGIDRAGIVVAINSDPDAPIFKYADYGIAGDATAVIPAINNALEKL